MNRGDTDLSLVMPCYNEEVAIGTTATDLVNCFAGDGVVIELILVDNGSTDRTGEVIDELMAKGYPVKKMVLSNNQGYGGGILEGLKACGSPVIGYLCADGQVSSEDALMAYRLIKGREDRTITKVRRRFRRDSWKRKVVSIIYNGLMQVSFGWLGAIDINGSPKLFSRNTFERMELMSRDWFLDPEIILKAKYLGLRIIEVDVEGRARRGGASNVNTGTCLEFTKNILRCKFGFLMKNWKEKVGRPKASHADGDPARTIESNVDPSLENHSSCERFDSLGGVRILSQKRHDDARGFLQKVLSASQCQGEPPRGEVYVTSARPGEAKGNHYHNKMGEWFTVVQGEGEINISDPRSGERMSVPMKASVPQTIYVPAGLAHSILNRSDDLLICVAWAEKEHDPEDVYPFPQ